MSVLQQGVPEELPMISGGVLVPLLRAALRRAADSLRVSTWPALRPRMIMIRITYS